MSKILIAASPPVGHVGPLLNVARGLVRRGDHVTFMTSNRYDAKIRAVGARPCAIPAAADYDDTSLDADLPGRAETSGIARVNFDVTQLLVRPLPHQASALDKVLLDNHFDVILTDGLFLGVVPMLLGDPSSRPPVLAYTTTPLFLRSRDTAPGGTGIPPMAGTIGRLRNLVLNVVAQRVLLRPSNKAADEALAVVGAPKLPVSVLDSGVLADHLIVPTIPEFEYPRSDLPPHVRFVGAVHPTPADDFSPPSWWSELDGGRPVVHVTQGTLDNADLTKLIEPTIAALADENVVLVVTTGGRDVSRLRDTLPANAFVEEYIPHDVLLPRVDVMVTNGGYGAVQRALSAGVPLVVAGNTEDKPEVASRVAWSGAGVNLHTATPTEVEVRRAVREILDRDTYRNAARTLQAAYGTRDGIAEISALIDEVVARRTLADGPSTI